MSAQDLRATMLAAILAQGIPLEQAMQDAEAAVAYVIQGPSKEGEPEPSRRDRVLDMWAQGVMTSAIGRSLGMKATAVSQVVLRARRDGDARAKSRHKGKSATSRANLVKARAAWAAKRAAVAQ